MAHQQQSAKVSSVKTASAATTSVIHLAINDKVIKAVNQQSPPQTILSSDPANQEQAVNKKNTNKRSQVADTTTSTVVKAKFGANLSDASESIVDTTKMIDSDSDDCSRTVLVDTKALNRQKELDERYGG